MKYLTPEMIEKAKGAKSAEELLALAKEGNFEMTEDEAKDYFAQLNPASGELTDDDLDNVAGGSCSGAVAETFKLGDRVRIRSALSYQCADCGSKTGTYIPYNNGTWGVMCDVCNNGKLIVLCAADNNPAATIEKI